MEQFSNWISVFCALVAAGLWLTSALVKIPPMRIGASVTDAFGKAMFDVPSQTNLTELGAALRGQSQWSKYAAFAAAGAALTQAAALIFAGSLAK